MKDETKSRKATNSNHHDEHDDLVALQLGLDAGQMLHHEKHDDLDILKIVQRGCRQNWQDWRQIFSQLGHELNESAGFLFERWIASTLVKLGLDNLCRNLRLCGAEGNSLLEVDVLAATAGKLLIFDCKLRGDSESDHADDSARRGGKTAEQTAYHAQYLWCCKGKSIGDQEVEQTDLPGHSSR